MSFTHLRPDAISRLKVICDHLLCFGKGILAADESPSLMASRMDALQISSGLEYIKRFRSLLFDTPGMADYLNGILMYPETAFEREGGDLLMFHTDYLKRSGILCGAKFDMGKCDIPGTSGERTTIAPDNLQETSSRLADLGFDFAKWRIAIKIEIEEPCPSELALKENALSAAKFCTICHENMLLPIVQLDWSLSDDCDLDHCKTVVATFLTTVVHTMVKLHVYVEGVLLMMKMVAPGKNFAGMHTSEEIAKTTFEAIENCVPPAVPGILFCTGDLDDCTVTECINEMHPYFQQYKMEMPWKYTFCLGRGLHYKALKIWRGILNDVPLAQEAFLNRLQDVCRALLGTYFDPVKKEEEEKQMQIKKVFTA